MEEKKDKIEQIAELLFELNESKRRAELLAHLDWETGADSIFNDMKKRILEVMQKDERGIIIKSVLLEKALYDNILELVAESDSFCIPFCQYLLRKTKEFLANEIYILNDNEEDEE